MAEREDLDFTYSLIDRVFRLSLGELADFSGAKYDGDFSLSLEEAQQRKHEYVADRIGIGAGRRVLDLGCGWGPLLAFIRERGAEGGGGTPSPAQVEASSGRLDYIETISQWRRRFAERSPRKLLMKARLVPCWLTSADFRLAFT